MSAQTVLVVDDDPAVRDALVQTLELNDLKATSFSSFVAAKDHITADLNGVILSDMRMPGRDGFHLLAYAQEQDPDLPVVLLTGEGDIPMAVKAIGEGAFDFLEKPCAQADLLRALHRALQTRTLVLENRNLRVQVTQGDPAARMIFGQSEASEALRARARKVAEAGSDALILGPPGSGISKVAEVIHLCSSTPTAPFVKRGGAALDVSGLDQALSDARGGAIFIDEVTGLSPEVQAALLDRLDAGAGTRVLLGSSADLKMALAASSFNAELYYRLSGVTVRISALAERREDIPVLFRHYVEVAAEQAGLEPPDVTPDILSDLMARDWPGNGRALMSEAMRFALGLREEGDADTGMGLAEQMAQVEKSLLETALRRARGRAISAAETLKLPKKTFYDKLARYGIRPEDFRRG